MIDPQTLFTHLGGIPYHYPVMHSKTNHNESDVPYLTHPGIVVLSQPNTVLAGLQEFLEGFDEKLDFSDYTRDETVLQDGTQLCKVAGQLCYMSFGPKRTKNVDAARYFDNIKSSRHGSVTEHANYTFLLYGISRSVTHELVRHRHFSLSQVSQRYVSGKMLRFVERPEYVNDEILHQQFLARITWIAREHQALVDRLVDLQRSGMETLSAEAKTDLRKKVQQAARSVLPNETEAPIAVTGNARAWRHFIEMRASEHAEIEMRELAIRVFLCLRQCDEILFDDYRVEQLKDGTYTVKTDYEKV